MSHKVHEMNPKLKPKVKLKSNPPRQVFTSVNIAELHSFRCPPSPNNDPLFNESLVYDRPGKKLTTKAHQISRQLDLKTNFDTSANFSTISKSKDNERSKLNPNGRSVNERQADLRHLASYNFDNPNLRPQSRVKDTSLELERKLLRSQGLNLDSMHGQSTSRTVKSFNLITDRSTSVPRRKAQKSQQSGSSDTDEPKVPYGKIITQRQKEAVHKIYGSKMTKNQTEYTQSIDYLKTPKLQASAKQSFYYLNQNNQTVFSN